MSRPDDPHSQPDEGAESLGLVVDLLYGELSEDEAARAEERIREDESLGETLEAFRGIRSLYKELPEEEPASALSAKLLAAAAEDAPARPSQGGILLWLGDFFGSMAMHPGLAAAASLVVVAGVAGTLYLAGKGDVVQPHVASEERAAADPGASRFDDSPGYLPSGADDSKDEAEDSLDLEAKESAAVSSTAAQPKANVPQPAPARTQRPRKLADKREAAPRPSTKSKSKRGRTGGSRPSTLGGVKGEVSTGGLVGTPSDDGDERTPDVARSVSGPQEPPVAAPEPRPEPPPAAPTPVAEKVQEESAPDEGQQAQVSVKELLERARNYTRKGDCAKVDRIGAEIRQRDERYYRNVFMRDKIVSRCVSKAKKRRTPSRKR